MNKYGELVDNSTVRFERLLPGPIERVWDYVTVGEKRAKWLAGGETEQREGGLIELKFHNASLSDLPDIDPPEGCEEEKVEFDGRVIRCEPHSVFVHTWNDGEDYSEVSYELEEVGDKIKFTLTHRRLKDVNAVRSVCGGWHAHLDVLEDVLEGREVQPFWATHAPMAKEYQARINIDPGS